MWNDNDFSPETVDEQLEYLLHIPSHQQLNAMLAKELKDTCEEDQMILKRTWTRYTAHINTQRAHYVQPVLGAARPVQSNEDSTLSVMMHRGVKSTSWFGRVFTLVAALMVAVVLVGSSLWMVNALHTFGGASPRPAKVRPGTHHSLTPTPPAVKSSLTPSGRVNAQVVYDDATSTLLLFSGQDYTGTPSLTDTWVWNGSIWTHMHPIHSPSPRVSAAMAYDPGTQQIVLYGGLSTTGKTAPLGDTWIWTGSDWIQQHPASSPSERMLASLAYDRASGQLILFGGKHTVGFGPSDLNDTWVWTGSNWVQQHPATTPSARSGASLVYDNASTQELVLFGGQDGYNQTLNDTWVWTGSNWVQQHPATAPILSATLQGQAVTFAHPSMVYNPSVKKLMLTLIGQSANDGVQKDYWTQANWIWDGSNWTELNITDLGVEQGQTFYDTRQHSIFELTSFVPRTSAVVENKLWEWTGHTWVVVESW